jgi:hypothetical protein
MTSYHNRAAEAVINGQKPDRDDVAAALHGARSVARIGQLEAAMGVDDKVAQALEEQGTAVGVAIAAVVDALAGVLDASHAVALRTWSLENAHRALLSAGGDDREMATVTALPFGLAVVEPGPGRSTADPTTLPPRPLEAVSDDELEEEILRRLKERGVA